MLDTMTLHDVLKAYDLEVSAFNRMLTFAQETARCVLYTFCNFSLYDIDLVDTPMRNHRI